MRHDLHSAHPFFPSFFLLFSFFFLLFSSRIDAFETRFCNFMPDLNK